MEWVRVSHHARGADDNGVLSDDARLVQQRLERTSRSPDFTQRLACHHR
jgi:hypothetical protein